MKRILFGLALLLHVTVYGERLEINSDLEVVKLTDHLYEYTSWSTIGRWGRVGSNGLLVVDQGELLLIDTPMEESATATLVAWAEHYFGATLRQYIAGHWHDDCVGGIEYLHREGVKSYANSMTISILKSLGRPYPEVGFKDSLRLEVGEVPLTCYYYGGGHSYDNIVVWFPNDSILFGGCLIKDMSASNLGNTEDAALSEWKRTIKRIKQHYSGALIIPGHGANGGVELLDHTIYLLERDRNKHHHIKP